MNSAKIIHAALFAGMILLCLSVPAGADIYFESEQVTQGIPGQADGTKVIKQHLTMDGAMMDLGDSITIMDFNKKLIYELDIASKTYKRTRVEDFGPAGESGALAQGPEKQVMEAMLKTMADSFKVTPTNEYKLIDGYKCRKYQVDFMIADSEYWATREFKGYSEMKAIGQKMAGFFASNPLLKQVNIAGMIAELDGFPIQTATSMMGGTIRTTVKKLEHKKLSRSLFQVPQGYMPAQN